MGHDKPVFALSPAPARFVSWRRAEIEAASQRGSCHLSPNPAPEHSIKRPDHDDISQVLLHATADLQRITALSPAQPSSRLDIASRLSSKPRSSRCTNDTSSVYPSDVRTASTLSELHPSLHHANRRDSDEITVILDRPSALRRRALSGAASHTTLTIPSGSPLSPRSTGSRNASFLALPSPRNDQPLSQTLRDLGARRQTQRPTPIDPDWTARWQELKREEERLRLESERRPRPSNDTSSLRSHGELHELILPKITRAGHHAARRRSQDTMISSTTRGARSDVVGRSRSARISRFVRRKLSIAVPRSRTASSRTRASSGSAMQRMSHRKREVQLPMAGAASSSTQAGFQR